MGSFVVRCALLVAVLCVCCQVLETKKQHNQYNQRRGDLHRIVLKTKNKGSRYKKPLHSHPDYHHSHYQDDALYDPYLEHSSEASFHHETFDDAPYAPTHQYNRFRDHERYKERQHYHTHKPYKQYDYEPSYKHQQHQQHQQPQLQQYDFDPYKHQQQAFGPTQQQQHPGDYRNYRDMMEEYNRKQEEEFRRQVEKSKLHMQYNHMQQAVHHQQQQQQQAQQQPVQEAYHFSESQQQPVWNTANDFRGDWSPISQSETPYNPSNSYTNNIPTYDTPSTTPQPQHYAQYSIELTTAKPQKMPAIIIEKNTTKGNKHKTVNYNFNQQYFPNHKPVANQYQGGTKEHSYDVKEPNEENSSPAVSYQNSAIVSSSYSTLWANQENETKAYEDHTGAKGHFGTRTKVRRTKRPAYTTQ